jgi:hypothetical protein
MIFIFNPQIFVRAICDVFLPFDTQTQVGSINHVTVHTLVIRSSPTVVLEQSSWQPDYDSKACARNTDNLAARSLLQSSNLDVYQTTRR